EFGAGEGGEEERNQEGDDGDDDEEFDEGEGGRDGETKRRREVLGLGRSAGHSAEGMSGRVAECEALSPLRGFGGWAARRTGGSGRSRDLHRRLLDAAAARLGGGLSGR